MATVKEIYDFMDGLYPFSLQDTFDNCGLNVGDFNAEVSVCLLALDITDAIIDEAIEKGAQLIVTHHPVIFDPVKELRAGNLEYRLAENHISHIAAHTNLDRAVGGANDALARIIGLRQIRMLNEENMYGRLGTLKAEESPEAFAVRCRDALGCEKVKLSAGNRPVKTVAVNTGAGSFSLPDVLQQGADAFLTGEIKLAEVLLAKKAGVTIVEAGHFETENMVLDVLLEKFGTQFPKVSFAEAETNTTMWKFI